MIMYFLYKTNVTCQSITQWTTQKFSFKNVLKSNTPWKITSFHEIYSVAKRKRNLHLLNIWNNFQLSLKPLSNNKRKCFVFHSFNLTNNEAFLCKRHSRFLEISLKSFFSIFIRCASFSFLFVIIFVCTRLCCWRKKVYIYVYIHNFFVDCLIYNSLYFLPFVFFHSLSALSSKLLLLYYVFFLLLFCFLFRPSGGDGEDTIAFLVLILIVI